MTSQTVRYDTTFPVPHAVGNSLDVWWHHIRMPLAAFVALAMLFATTGSDIRIAHAFFFDAHHGWIGADSWWTNELLHKTGQWAIRLLVLTAIGFWFATFGVSNFRELRRPIGYAIAAFLLSVSVVGLLKWTTNVYCPWDLVDFGGAHPYAHVFSHRSASMPRGQCFPAGHASSGYALVALFFVLKERSARWAKIALSTAAIVGLTFGLGQQSRGAHFISHDVWSAFLAWTASASVYAFAFGGRLWDRPASEEPARYFARTTRGL
jgi:membrane-associated PAP2 superfamily phosphatase